MATASSATFNDAASKGKPGGTAKDIARYLRLISPNGEPIEIRSWLPGSVAPLVAFFTSVEDAAKYCEKTQRAAEGIYTPFNPFDLDAIQEEQKATGKKGMGTSDKHIIRRTWMLVDCDPERESGLSATDDEKAGALEVITAVRDHLAECGWPEPIFGDSGNGYHAYYAIDLPPDDESRDLIKACLHSLGERFDVDGRAKIDRVVYNASRIAKVLGTLARKGEATHERPHRTSALIEVPDEIEAVPLKLLRSLAARAQRAKAEQASAAPTESPFVGHATDGNRPNAEARATLYLSRCDPSISGQGGHSQAFKTACAIGPGFDLSPDVAFRLLRDHWNHRCQPPWSEKELRHKIDEAFEKETRRGWLLEEDRHRANGKATGGGRGRRSGEPGSPEPKGSPDLDAALAPVEATDTGNADRLVARFGEQIRYCHSWKSWLVWDGRRWTVDNVGRVVEFAKATARAILNEAGTVHDDEPRKQLAKWSFASQSAARIAAMVKLAESAKSIAVEHEDLNRDPWAFNCLNGTIDLRTGALRPHRREDLITQLAPTDYDPSAECPLWLETLGTFFRRADPEDHKAIVSYWQKILGYSMTAVTDEHVLPIAFGSGSNGKSTMLEMVMDVFGEDYAAIAPENLLMARKFDSHPTELADLYGKRLVVGIETDEGRRLNESRVKSLSDGTPVKARRMHEDFWQFKPTHTLILATNHRPKVKGSDFGIWRRLKLVPFTVTMPDAQADKQFPRKLRGLVDGFPGEHAGVLAWCVAGCVRWQAEGLNPPEDVTAATESYRQEQDIVGQFLLEFTKPMPGAKIKAGTLYSIYKTWADEAGETPLSQRAFGESITTKGYEKTTSNGVHYLGLALLREEKEGGRP